MKSLHPTATLLLLVFLVTTGQTTAAGRTAQDCRIRAGLTGDEPLTVAAATTMYNCVDEEIRKIDRQADSQMTQFRTWRDEHDRLLIAGNGRLAARTCQEEKNNRRYIENRLGDVGKLRDDHKEHAEKYETLYRDYIFELNVMFLGISGAGETLADLTRAVNDDLVKRLEGIDRDQKALQNFYVDLQQTRFQDACGTAGTRTPPPTAHTQDCKWQTRAAFNSIRGLARSNATGYVCTCRPEDGRSVWPAADSRRCGPYPDEQAGGGTPAMAPSPSPQPSSPAAASPGGWQPVQ